MKVYQYAIIYNYSSVNFKTACKHILTTGTNPGSPFCPYEVKRKTIWLVKYNIIHVLDRNILH